MAEQQWPAKAEPYGDARDDGEIVLSAEAIAACTEELLARIREPKVLPAPITDPALADEEDEQ